METLWAGIFHIFFPKIASASIGWAPSPFEFEIGVADIAIGVAAIVAFWRSLEFKAAVTLYIVLFYVGVAIGHVHLALVNNDYSPNNFGILLAMTVIKVFLLSSLYLSARWEEERSR